MVVTPCTGTLFDEPWLIEQDDSGYLRLRAELRAPWPFPGWAVQEFALHATHLDLRLEVHSAGPPFPATAGWHPWFRRHLSVGGDLEVDLRARRWYPRDDGGLPTGELEPVPPPRPWDDCFTDIAWPATLTWPGAIEMTMTSTCTHAVLYDEEPHAICVEPQSGPPDALNLDRAHIVRRDAPLVIETSLSWRGR